MNYPDTLFTKDSEVYNFNNYKVLIIGDTFPYYVAIKILTFCSNNIVFIYGL